MMGDSHPYSDVLPTHCKSFSAGDHDVGDKRASDAKLPGSPNGQQNGSIAGGVGSVPGAGKEEETQKCGWGRFHPPCFQRFGNIRGYVALITLCGATTGMAINGFVNAVTSTIERRYEISSTEAGIIASCYDIMFMLLVIPISYFGGHGNKPRYLGIGIFVLGIGCFVFSIPHFVSGHYKVTSAQESTCRIHSNNTDPCLDLNTGNSLSHYKYLFFLGQMLNGAGCTALYTLGISYIDENVSQRTSPFYNGIFFTGTLIGPAIGYIVGSELLNIYVDLDVDPATLGLDPKNPRWVGAWWIGFLLSGALAVMLSIPLLAFPTRLPGSEEFAAERDQEVQVQSGADVTGQSRGLRDICLTARMLLTNKPFMFFNIAGAADAVIASGFSTFMPKFIEYQFGVTAASAALYVGLTVVPAGGGATFLGGFLIRYFDLRVRGVMRLCVVASLLFVVTGLALLMECATPAFAGVTQPYGELDSAATFLGESSLTSVCNSACECAERDYYPMCGRDGVLYFSPCHAGCVDTVAGGRTQLYTNCSCVMYNLTTSDLSPGGDPSQGSFGKCENPCKLLTLFMVLFGLQIVLMFITYMPCLTVVLRTVPDHQRTFGLGIQFIVTRCLGSIPGPIMFGVMFDMSCLLWQHRCDGEGSCFFYDNRQTAINLLVLVVVFSIIAAASFILALACYKTKSDPEDMLKQPPLVTATPPQLAEKCVENTSTVVKCVENASSVVNTVSSVVNTVVLDTDTVSTALGLHIRKGC